MRFFLIILSFVMVTPVLAQESATTRVEAAVADLTKALINADSSSLAALFMDQLTYGHSSGIVENKQQAIERLITGKSDFVTIDLSEQQVQVLGKTAIVRHIFSATTNDGGKPGDVKIKVLQVWQKVDGKWKLLARQAVRLT
ncbi:MAG: nuclear transport factor 2 family protein [Chitinophagaceae bacterium]